MCEPLFRISVGAGSGGGGKAIFYLIYVAFAVVVMILRITAKSDATNDSPPEKPDADVLEEDETPEAPETDGAKKKSESEPDFEPDPESAPKPEKKPDPRASFEWTDEYDRGRHDGCGDDPWESGSKKRSGNKKDPWD